MIGVTDRLIQFDQLQFELKAQKQKEKKIHKHLLSRHADLLAKLQSALLKKKADIRKEIQSFQHAYFAKYHTAPTEDEPVLRSLVKKRDLASKLLRNWNIDL